MSSFPKSRVSAVLASCAASILFLSAASFYGCAPEGAGVIDMAKSKAIAAENGADARFSGPKTSSRKKKNTTAQPGIQGRSQMQ